MPKTPPLLLPLDFGQDQADQAYKANAERVTAEERVPPMRRFLYDGHDEDALDDQTWQMLAEAAEGSVGSPSPPAAMNTDHTLAFSPDLDRTLLTEECRTLSEASVPDTDSYLHPNHAIQKEARTAHVVQDPPASPSSPPSHDFGKDELAKTMHGKLGSAVGRQDELSASGLSQNWRLPLERCSGTPWMACGKRPGEMERRDGAGSSR